MKTIVVLFALASLAVAEPPKRITNREFPDGTGSSKEMDPTKRESVETFYDRSRKVVTKVVYKLDERLQPLSAIYYNGKGVVYQKCTFKLDGEDRVIQEVIYDPQNRLVGTKNYNYGTKNGKTVVAVDTYDSNGNLIRPAQGSSNRRTR